MPTFEKCPAHVESLATSLLERYPDHDPIVAKKVKIDYVFACADKDKFERPLNNALTRNGIKALGITRKTTLKERAMGRGDAEISIDGDWWSTASDREQAALLDHELHHIALKEDKHGNAMSDDLQRPLLELRKHDVEVGFFKVIANRHGEASQERQQARYIMDKFGQAFWPEICGQLSDEPGKQVPLASLTKGQALSV